MNVRSVSRSQTRCFVALTNRAFSRAGVRAEKTFGFPRLLLRYAFTICRVCAICLVSAARGLKTASHVELVRDLKTLA